jgi:hypothetical protein
MERRFAIWICFGAMLFCGGWMFAQAPPKPVAESESRIQPPADAKPAGELGQVLNDRGYTSIPLEHTNAGYLVVVVTINEKHIRLMLDTGAVATCVDIERTKHLNIDWEQLPGTVPLEGFPSWDVSKKCRIEMMDMSGFKAQGVIAHVHSLTNLNKALVLYKELPLDGVLGGDLLRYYSAIIDYQSARLYLRSRK